jgi:hypothetical protein
MLAPQHLFENLAFKSPEYQWEYTDETSSTKKWFPFQENYNILIEKAFRRINENEYTLSIANDNHLKNSDIKSSDRESVINFITMQQTMHDGKIRLVRCNKMSNVMQLTEFYFPVYFDTTDSCSTNSQSLLNSALLNNSSVTLLHNSFRLFPGDDFYFNSLKISMKEIAKHFIEYQPLQMRGYAILLGCSDEENMVYTLLNGAEVSKDWLLQKVVETSNDDPFAWYYLSYSPSFTEANKTHCQAIAFRVAGGCSVIHPFLEYFLNDAHKDKELSTERSINLLLLLLKLPYLQKDYEKNLDNPVIDEKSVAFFPFCNAILKDYRNKFIILIIDALFELSFNFKATKRIVSINRRFVNFSDYLNAFARSYGKHALGHRIYSVKGEDAGRNAWYMVLVTGSLHNFHHCLNDAIIHLEEHGEILCSAYGDEVPLHLKQKLMREYGLKIDGETDPANLGKKDAFSLKDLMNVDELYKVLTDLQFELQNNLKADVYVNLKTFEDKKILRISKRI